MKKVITGMFAAASLLAACNNSGTDKKESSITTEPKAAVTVDTSTKQVTAITEPTTPVSIKEILADYLQMKNAFAKDNDAAPAASGKEMVKAFAGFNKATLNTEQAKIYNDVEDDAKEHAEHIGANAGNIKHQREHFDMLSKDMYQLVKTFGAGQQLYYDHCPMYNDGKGANWLSETKEIANPYLGKSMPTCGTVKEELK
jgi:hypothetical protein